MKRDGIMDILLESKNIYDGHASKNNSFQSIGNAYLFTNEMINGYMPDLSGQDILSVAGSGDHYFNALLNNVNHVDLFDIDYISKFIIYLKKAGFENLDYDAFCMFFGLYNIHHIFDYDIYKSFRDAINEEAQIYWNYLYALTKYRGYSIYESDLVSNYHHHTEKILKSNNYFKEEEFLRLKKILSEISDISFIHTDINDLPPLLRRKYDSIFLSNIGTYQNNTSFIKIIKKLAKNLNNNGQIYFAYIYGNLSEKFSFYNQLLHSSHYRVENVNSDSKNFQNEKVYIYKK